jgi:hypothetical protein
LGHGLCCTDSLRIRMRDTSSKLCGCTRDPAISCFNEFWRFIAFRRGRLTTALFPSWFEGWTAASFENKSWEKITKFLEDSYSLQSHWEASFPVTRFPPHAKPKADFNHTSVNGSLSDADCIFLRSAFGCVGRCVSSKLINHASVSLPMSLPSVPAKRSGKFPGDLSCPESPGSLLY